MSLKKTEFEQLHSYVEESSGNENNICEITAIKNGSVVYEDYWHGYRRGDTLNIMSVTKSVIYINEAKGVCVGIAGTFKPRIFDRVQFIQKKIEPLL